jgi:hypothetical protein
MKAQSMNRRLDSPHPRGRFLAGRFFGGILAVGLTLSIITWWELRPTEKDRATPPAPAVPVAQLYPRLPVDTSGLPVILQSVEPWEPGASLSAIAQSFDRIAHRAIEQVEAQLASFDGSPAQTMGLILRKASCYMYAGEPEKAYEVCQTARVQLEREGGPLNEQVLSTLIYFQGVASLRQGENENCIMCRGESSCILPISPAAVHTNPDGSQRAIRHFMEYLEAFPDDLEVRWLLNLAHMTLGQYPHEVDPRFLIDLRHYMNPEDDIGKFRDIGHLVGVNRFNRSGGAVMEDFDNDGLLDLAVTSSDPRQPMALYRNVGNGKFDECTDEAGIADQLGGLVCVQTDYNNDGRMDIYIPRGAWSLYPMRPSLLRNEGGFRFTDVTADAGLLDPVNSNAAMWADYDNDGWLDLFVACEMQPNRLYRNLGNGTFQEVARQAGLSEQAFAKGCAWLDFDNDDFPDLFVNNLNGTGQLYRNNRDGSFSNVTTQLGVEGPVAGFSCWAWDYDNDGWLDIFATSYRRTLADVVKGLQGESVQAPRSALYRNREGKQFQDVAAEVGLDGVYATMGSNYGDFDNDGFLDMYLGTGEPDVAALMPNRMFRNRAGRRFAEITSAAGVGHLQKGHSVACGDWDRDGNVDVFIQMGGAIDGDGYHNILFQNPGRDHNWLTVKLVGQRTNRAAIGARIKIVTAGDRPLTVHRHISSGSSFGGNPLEQTIGLEAADHIAELEIHWPTSGTTQIFHEVAVNHAIEVTEFADDFRTLDLKRVDLPTEGN